MRNSLHHVHAFASDVDASVRFYTEVLGGEVILDEVMAGARNVFIRIGDGRLHLYDQPPRHAGAGSIHHFGIRTDDIARHGREAAAERRAAAQAGHGTRRLALRDGPGAGRGADRAIRDYAGKLPAQLVGYF